jgi:hypothetical protein
MHAHDARLHARLTLYEEFYRVTITNPAVIAAPIQRA